jgi:hypothetical protein
VNFMERTGMTLTDSLTMPGEFGVFYFQQGEVA